MTDPQNADEGTLPVGVTTATSTGLDVLRNHIAGRLANAALRLATSEYRAFIGGSIRYGLQAATEAVEPSPPSPLEFPCRDCGAEVRQACRPIGGEHPRSIGYHDCRYDDAGWPPNDDEELPTTRASQAPEEGHDD